MALDSFDRVAALNAVIEAWTRKGSAPWILHLEIPGGTSKQIQVQPDWCAEWHIFGNHQDLLGLKMTFINTGYSTRTFNVYGAAGITITNASNVFTIANTTNRVAQVYITSFRGMAEEV